MQKVFASAAIIEKDPKKLENPRTIYLKSLKKEGVEIMKPKTKRKYRKGFCAGCGKKKNILHKCPGKKTKR